MLLETGDTELVEGNTWRDNFWGAIPETGRRLDGVPLYGRNQLGLLLMETRGLLVSEVDLVEAAYEPDEVIIGPKRIWPAGIDQKN
jgi:hypothetical protein